MILVLILIIVAVFLLSTSGATAEVSVLGVDTPLIPAAPVEKAPDQSFNPAPKLKPVHEPVSTFSPKLII